MEFDAQQDAAVAHRGSPLLIAGGPGTGKTSVLIAAAYLALRPVKILIRFYY